ncbi:hypothetical protein PsYK624_150400 [Phanerochaete sordida]|uniref:Uncharacterized protein n=1 Tax=Phanerochaete sordida TaxID=48140 RepID=A0A9P3LKP0_9APHY|nr:hypothetical protein PsYK624_150400 [Phanerochaete sordida]
MPAFTLSKNKAKAGPPKPKVARKASLKQWAGKMRRKLSTDMNKGLPKQGDTQSSVSEQILEENDGNRELVAEPQTANDLNLAANDEHDKENMIADEPTSSATTPAAAPEPPAEHNDEQPIELEATNTPATTEPSAAAEQSPAEPAAPAAAPTETRTEARGRSPPPPYHRTSVRLVPSAPPRPYTPLPLTAPHAPWHWLSAQLDDAPGAPPLRGCAPLKLSLVAALVHVSVACVAASCVLVCTAGLACAAAFRALRPSSGKSGVPRS